MESQLLEVKDGVLHTFDGDTHQVHGGAYMTPEAYLSTSAELQRLRERLASAPGSVLPAVVFGVALLGFAAGYWLGARDGDKDG